MGCNRQNKFHFYNMIFQQQFKTKTPCCSGSAGAFIASQANKRMIAYLYIFVNFNDTLHLIVADTRVTISFGVLDKNCQETVKKHNIGQNDSKLILRIILQKRLAVVAMEMLCLHHQAKMVSLFQRNSVEIENGSRSW